MLCGTCWSIRSTVQVVSSLLLSVLGLGQLAAWSQIARSHQSSAAHENSTSTRRSTLAGHPTAHHVQAVSAGVQVFTRLRTAVSCTSRRRHGAPQSALSHSRSTKFPLVQHDKLWSTSIFVRRPSCLELTARASTNHFNRPFQALSKNIFIRAETETFLFNELYKFTYLLTYLLTE